MLTWHSLGGAWLLNKQFLSPHWHVSWEEGQCLPPEGKGPREAKKPVLDASQCWPVVQPLEPPCQCLMTERCTEHECDERMGLCGTGGRNIWMELTQCSSLWALRPTKKALLWGWSCKECSYDFVQASQQTDGETTAWRWGPDCPCSCSE